MPYMPTIGKYLLNDRTQSERGPKVKFYQCHHFVPALAAEAASMHFE